MIQRPIERRVRAGATPPALDRLPAHAPSLVLLGLGARLAGALLIVALLWLAVAWSVAG
jgi:hypothetical protein